MVFSLHIMRELRHRLVTYAQNPKSMHLVSAGIFQMTSPGSHYCRKWWSRYVLFSHSYPLS